MALDDSNPQNNHSTPTSRRALLASALGAAAALGAQALARPNAVRAADGDAVLVGGVYTSTSVTKISNLTGGSSTTVLWGNSMAGIGVKGSSSGGYGVAGSSVSNNGVWGSSGTASGVYGTSTSHNGVYGFSNSAVYYGTVGWSGANSTGVIGFSDNGGFTLPAAHPKTGVYGYAAQDSDATGVWGETTSGHAVRGTATSGWAGFFTGKVYTSAFHEMKEIGVPTAPPADHGRLFMQDDGSGKTQLCVRFSSGAVQVLATQP